MASLLSVSFLFLLAAALTATAQGQLFSLATNAAGFQPRQGVITTEVNINTLDNPLWVPFLIGGTQPALGFYGNDVWFAPNQGPSGAWKNVNPAAPFARRAYGGLVNVPVGVGPKAFQILVLIGGQTLNGQLLNDIWSSTNLGSTWTQSTVAVAFTPRRSFGYVIGTPYDFASANNPLPFQTEYAFLFGGLTAAGAANDVYYTAGMGTMPWLPYPGGQVAPWSPRSRFGTTAYAGGSRVVIAGGLDANNQPLNEVWVWDFRSWVQVAQASPFPPSYFVNLVVTQNPSISQQTFYILAGAVQFNKQGPDNGAFQFLPTVYRSQDLSKWTDAGGPAASPIRAVAGGTISPINNVGYLFTGFNQQDFADVWFGQL